MPTLEERIQRIEDESAIRQLVARFADICTHGNIQAFPKLWVSRGDNKPMWTLTEPFAMSATGIDEIMGMARKLRDPRDFFVQLVHTGLLDINGDHATGRWIMHEVGKGPGEVYYNNFAFYEDFRTESGTLREGTTSTCFSIRIHSQASCSMHRLSLRCNFPSNRKDGEGDHFLVFEQGPL